MTLNNSNAVYVAVYSGVPVYEMQCRSVAVMRRRDDSYLNATQILKVAGVDKGRRTKILEKEVQIGVHEKVQGGYGKYQGTWIPFERGVNIARQYGVEEILKPILDFIPSHDDFDHTPKKKRASFSRAPKEPSQQQSQQTRSMSVDGLGQPQPISSGLSNAGKVNSSQANLSQHQVAAQSMSHQNLLANAMPKPQPAPGERYRPILMSVFLNSETQKLPELLTSSSKPSDFDANLVIDDQGHTSVHWASALGRINVLHLLYQANADLRKLNYSGESALIRSVLVTNNFDRDTFYDLLNLLHPCIPLTDRKGRTIIHHIILTSGIKGRLQASLYYLDNLLEFMSKNGMNSSALIDVQDKNGDTALNIATRIGHIQLMEQLLAAGADSQLPNRAGLRPVDFAIEDPSMEAVLYGKNLPNKRNPDLSASNTRYQRPDYHEFESASGTNDESQIQDVMLRLQNANKELEENRKIIGALNSKISNLESKSETPDQMDLVQ